MARRRLHRAHACRLSDDDVNSLAESPPSARLPPNAVHPAIGSLLRELRFGCRLGSSAPSEGNLHRLLIQLLGRRDPRATELALEIKHHRTRRFHLTR